MKDLKGSILRAGEEELEGAKIDSGDYKLLIVQDDSSISDHLNRQPSIYAYYAVLLYLAKKDLEKVTYTYDQWRSQCYRIVSQELAGKVTMVEGSSRPVTKKSPTIGDINSEIDFKYEKEIAEQRKKIEEATDTYEVLKVWVMAWQMKKDTLMEVGRMARKDIGGYDSNIYEGSGHNRVPGKIKAIEKEFE
jgi:hypothetical protein